MKPRDLALALIVVVAWGVNFVVVKVGVTHVPPLLLGALRFMLAAFPALLFVPRPDLPLKFYLAYGLTASVGQFAFLFTAVQLGMPTGLASLVLQSQAFFTLVLAALFLKEHWGAHQLGGLALAGGQPRGFAGAPWSLGEGKEEARLPVGLPDSLPADCLASARQGGLGNQRPR